MDDASFGVGSMAANRALVGHLLGGEVRGDGGGLVGNAGSGWPDGRKVTRGGSHQLPTLTRGHLDARNHL